MCVCESLLLLRLFFNPLRAPGDSSVIPPRVCSNSSRMDVAIVISRSLQKEKTNCITHIHTHDKYCVFMSEEKVTEPREKTQARLPDWLPWDTNWVGGLLFYTHKSPVICVGVSQLGWIHPTLPIEGRISSYFLILVSSQLPFFFLLFLELKKERKTEVWATRQTQPLMGSASGNDNLIPHPLHTRTHAHIPLVKCVTDFNQMILRRHSFELAVQYLQWRGKRSLPACVQRWVAEWWVNSMPRGPVAGTLGLERRQSEWVWLEVETHSSWRGQWRDTWRLQTSQGAATSAPGYRESEEFEGSVEGEEHTADRQTDRQTK